MGVLLALLIIGMSLAVGIKNAFAGVYVTIPAVVLVMLIAATVFLLRRLNSQERERIDKVFLGL